MRRVIKFLVLVISLLAFCAVGSLRADHDVNPNSKPTGGGQGRGRKNGKGKYRNGKGRGRKKKRQNATSADGVPFSPDSYPRMAVNSTNIDVTNSPNIKSGDGKSVVKRQPKKQPFQRDFQNANTKSRADDGRVSDAQGQFTASYYDQNNVYERSVNRSSRYLSADEFRQLEANHEKKMRRTAGDDDG